MAVFVWMLQGAPASSAESVRIGVPNWPSVEITARVIGEIAERFLDIDAEIVHASNDEIMAGLHEGRGAIDIHPEAWMPNHRATIETYNADRQTIILSPIAYNAIQGLCVPRGPAEQYGISAVHQLADPAISPLLDADGDGKGEIWIGAEGWSSTNVERVKAKSYGYDKVLRIDTYEESEALKRLRVAVDNGRLFAFFCYGPHHMFQLHDLILLEEPAYDPARWNMIQPSDDPDWLEKSSVDVGWPETRVHIAYANNLRLRLPKIAQLLDRIELNSRLVSAWTYAVVVDRVDPETFAAEWVQTHPETVEAWLGL